MMRMSSPTEPIEVIEVGVNKASVFKGYCVEHDSRIFAPIETSAADKKRHLSIAMHVRAISLEFARKRWVADYYLKLSQLFQEDGIHEFQEVAKQLSMARDHFKGVLYYFFFATAGGNNDGIDYFFLPFSGNLMVSSCGLFTRLMKDRGGYIGYNLISYSTMSLLALTTFKSTASALDSFLKDYGYPENANLERLINDIAFSKGEEPIIAPVLWQSLSKSDQMQVRQSLRPPGLRMSVCIPRIIKLTRENLAEPSPRMWAHLFGSKAASDVVTSCVRVRKRGTQR
jgi:hypothetical protein